MLDPEGDDRREFLAWVLEPALGKAPDAETVARLDELTVGYSAAAFASLRSGLKARAASGPLEVEEVEAILRDYLPPAIGETRRYQTLQALVNCTRRSLLPDPDVTEDDRDAWQGEIRVLEARGIR